MGNVLHRLKCLDSQSQQMALFRTAVEPLGGGGSESLQSDLEAFLTADAKWQLCQAPVTGPGSLWANRPDPTFPRLLLSGVLSQQQDKQPVMSGWKTLPLGLHSTMSR